MINQSIYRRDLRLADHTLREEIEASLQDSDEHDLSDVSQVAKGLLDNEEFQEFLINELLDRGFTVERPESIHPSEF